MVRRKSWNGKERLCVSLVTSNYPSMSEMNTRNKKIKLRRLLLSVRRMKRKKRKDKINKKKEKQRMKPNLLKENKVADVVQTVVVS